MMARSFSVIVLGVSLANAPDVQYRCCSLMTDFLTTVAQSVIRVDLSWERKWIT